MKRFLKTSLHFGSILILSCTVLFSGVLSKLTFGAHEKDQRESNVAEGDASSAASLFAIPNAYAEAPGDGSINFSGDGCACSAGDASASDSSGDDAGDAC